MPFSESRKKIVLEVQQVAAREHVPAGPASTRPTLERQDVVADVVHRVPSLVAKLDTEILFEPTRADSIMMIFGTDTIRVMQWATPWDHFKADHAESWLWRRWVKAHPPRQVLSHRVCHFATEVRAASDTRRPQANLVPVRTGPVGPPVLWQNVGGRAL